MPLTPTTRAQVKRAAARLRLLKPLYKARIVWMNTRAVDAPYTSSVPLPPPRLRTLVAGTPSVEHFLQSGKLSADAVRSAAASVGCTPTTVLDFGCGCGRTIRHWPQTVTLYGCDTNADLVDWCRRNLTFATFSVNGPMPPLEYPTGSFDLVYAISVFTHLTEPSARAWMAELTRILAPGGILVVTTHGDSLAAEALGRRERAAYAAGHIVVTYPQSEGENLCAAYHPVGSVAALAPGLEHVLHRPQALEAHDIHVLARRDENTRADSVGPGRSSA
jgi:SAM-dependent methyltransferase